MSSCRLRTRYRRAARRGRRWPRAAGAAFCQCRSWAAIQFFSAAVGPALPAAASLVELTFDNPGALLQGDADVGPAGFTVAAQFTALVCNDYVAELAIGETWAANVSTFADLSQTKYAAAGPPAYAAAAWLYEAGLRHPTAWGDIQFALWAVFNPAPVTASAGWTPRAASWLATAQQQIFTGDEFPTLRIYTPTQLTGPGAPPEFMGTAAVPEVGIVPLVGLGLGLIVLFRHWRRRHDCRCQLQVRFWRATAAFH